MFRVWRMLLDLGNQTVLERVEVNQASRTVVAHVRPKRSRIRRCGVCGRVCPHEDAGAGRRRWRSHDLGTTRVWLEAAAPRVRCGEHGIVVALVPWARHGSRQTRDFEDTVAWLVTQTSRTAVSQLLRITWRTVGSIITRVVADIDARTDRLAGLTRIGIDEVSYKKGHKYLTVVVDHDTGRLVWAAPGRDRATLEGFFDALGPDRCAAITHVSADAAAYIAAVVTRRCPAAVQCADPFHVVAWATEALDVVRREEWNAAAGRHRGVRGNLRARATGQARALKHARYALWKNPENLTDRQAAKLAWIARTNPRLHRAYLLKEGLRWAFKVKGEAGKDALDRWIAWAQRCRIPSFVALAKRIRAHRTTINATLDHGLSQGLIESTNTKIRVLHRMAFGFRHPDALIALAMLALGGHRPALPNRP